MQTEKEISLKWVDKFEHQYIRQDTKLRNHYFQLFLLSLKFKIPINPFDRVPPKDDQLETLVIGKSCENKEQNFRENPCDGPELQTSKLTETNLEHLISLNNFTLPNEEIKLIIAPLHHKSGLRPPKE